MSVQALICRVPLWPRTASLVGQRCESGRAVPAVSLTLDLALSHPELFWLSPCRQYVSRRPDTLSGYSYTERVRPETVWTVEALVAAAFDKPGPWVRQLGSVATQFRGTLASPMQTGLLVPHVLQYSNAGASGGTIRVVKSLQRDLGIAIDVMATAPRGAALAAIVFSHLNFGADGGVASEAVGVDVTRLRPLREMIGLVSAELLAPAARDLLRELGVASVERVAALTGWTALAHVLPSITVGLAHERTGLAVVGSWLLPGTRAELDALVTSRGGSIERAFGPLYSTDRRYRTAVEHQVAKLSHQSSSSPSSSS